MFLVVSFSLKNIHLKGDHHRVVTITSKRNVTTTNDNILPHRQKRQYNTDTVVTGELSERKKREISPHLSTYTHGDCLMFTCEWRATEREKKTHTRFRKRGQRTSPIKQKHTGHWRLSDRLLVEKQQQKVRKTISSFSCGHQTLTTKCRFV